MKSIKENNNRRTELKASDLRRGESPELMERVIAKIHELDGERFDERRLARKARILTELVRESMSGRYPHLSMKACAEILLALLEFIEVEDEIRDTLDGGFTDDLRRLGAACSNNRSEIERYLAWRRRNGS